MHMNNLQYEDIARFLDEIDDVFVSRLHDAHITNLNRCVHRRQSQSVYSRMCRKHFTNTQN